MILSLYRRRCSFKETKDGKRERRLSYYITARDQHFVKITTSKHRHCAGSINVFVVVSFFHRLRHLKYSTAQKNLHKNRVQYWGDHQINFVLYSTPGQVLANKCIKFALWISIHKTPQILYSVHILFHGFLCIPQEIVVGNNMDKIYIVMDFVEHDLKALMETMTQAFLAGKISK